MMTPTVFAQTLAELRMRSVFNPYADVCRFMMRPMPPAFVSATLSASSMQRSQHGSIRFGWPEIWAIAAVGGPCALTDEIHLEKAGALLGGVKLHRATRGPLVAERTAAVIWGALSRIEQPVVLWNVFPLHPHEKEDPLTNRCHTRAERDATWSLFEALLGMIQPKRIVAIGRDAGMALAAVDLPLYVVRHPSYGGQKEFLTGITRFIALSGKAEPVSEPELPLLPVRRRAVA